MTLTLCCVASNLLLMMKYGLATCDHYHDYWLEGACMKNKHTQILFPGDIFDYWIFGPIIYPFFPWMVCFFFFLICDQKMQFVNFRQIFISVAKQRRNNNKQKKTEMKCRRQWNSFQTIFQLTPLKTLP